MSACQQINSQNKSHNNQGAFPWQPSPLPASVPCIVATLRRTKLYITSPPCEIQLLLPLIRREQDPLSASRVLRQMSDSVRLSAESSYGQESSEFSSPHTRGDASASSLHSQQRRTTPHAEVSADRIPGKRPRNEVHAWRHSHHDLFRGQQRALEERRRASGTHRMVQRQELRPAG